MPGQPTFATVPAASPGAQASVIANSHQRCEALGLGRATRASDALVSGGELNLALQRNERLCLHAAPVMEMLLEQIVSSKNMVLLTDAAGTVLHAIGDNDFLSRAARVALQPGANWSEAAQGTNAVGTALVDEVPTRVHADEHFIRANHFLTCSAAPILDPRGNILGVLDVSGDRQGYHPHTMALVKMSARMIENHWLTDDHRLAMRLHFHRRPDVIGTLMEGILAVEPDGRIIGANRGAQELLGLGGAALRAHTVASLFDLPMGVLVDRFRHPLGQPLPVTLADGRRLYMQARFNGPLWTASAAHLPPQGEATLAIEEATALPAEDRRRPATAPSARQPGALDALRSGDPQVAAVVDKIQRVLDRDIPILLLGETGTGKEVFARAIHRASQRAAKPFVAVNCASIPETLIEAELFGYEEGAFTGARRRGAVGKIVQAHGGVLFLDEIGDMPLSLQAHLLRVLQERQVTPLGGSRPIPVDVTVLCATHRHLREMIEAKSFREDLYYRLNGLALKLPPLRERSDLPALVQRLLAELSPERELRLSSEVRRLFQHYPWPGNVRQLHNVLRTACVMTSPALEVLPEHLPDDFLEEAGRSLREAIRRPALWAEPADTTAGTAPTEARAAVPLQTLAQQAIRQALEQAGGNVSLAARQLGVSRNTVYRALRGGQTG
ncbi:sigma-54-dependent Fis family transcriptional regulator [Ideonella sp. B7]|uniref:sigma-54-dependent Fis family transcriptional regulator n=1 Tax=Ideonella benzenivorans TaxID=2831643 RepID=UPI001CEDF9E0|nr:sigma-54-dependent Fis family transcriptional regulator [Ideonella benzenivorans]MCA6216682.1 sigma-54-dependent Fis family transcriptional regulator [Ideonella benzenivorans]